MRYRLVIFDWDGTLMDSAARIVDCMHAASRDAGWGELPADAIRNIIGLGLPDAIATLCPGIDPDRAELLRSRYAWHFVEGSDTPCASSPAWRRGWPACAAGTTSAWRWPPARAAAASIGCFATAAAGAGSTPAAPPTRPVPSPIR